jgi:hypothetical protein
MFRQSEPLIMRNTFPQMERGEYDGTTTAKYTKEIISLNNLKTLVNLLITLLSLLFQAFIFYSLISSNTSSVSKACGDSLWNFILSRFILAFVELMFLAVANAALHIEEEPYYYNVRLAVFFIILHIVYICLEATFVHSAMANSSCVSALSNSSFSSTPLLGILGYIYLVLDSLVVFLSISASCYMISENAQR